jgi:hypothetical protein
VRGPALDSAGFFVALYGGLFKAQGLNVHFTPATSSETVMDPVGSVDTIGLQRVVNVMQQFIGFPKFNIDTMIMPGPQRQGGSLRTP